EAGGAMLAWVGRVGYGSYVFVERITSTGVAAWPNIYVNGQSTDTYAAATDGSGGMILTWTEGARPKASRVTTAGLQPWGTITACDTLNSNSYPAIAPDGSGGCYISWKHGTNYFADIWAQHLNATGQRQWTPNGIPVCTAPDAQYGVSVALSVSGGVGDGCLLTWGDYRGGSNYYGQKLDPSGTALWGENGTLLCGSMPHQVSDGQGGLIAAWEWWPEGIVYVGRNIRAIRLNAAGQNAWPQGAVQVCLVPGDEQMPAIVPQGDGFLTVFAGGLYGQDGRKLSFQKLDYATGTRLLGDAGRSVVSYPPSTGSEGYAAPLADGRTALFWTAGVQTYYQILDIQGQPTLSADTAIIVPDTTGMNPYYYWAYASQACADGSGGFFALLGAGNDEDGYAAFLAHVSADGHVMGDGTAKSVWDDADVGYESGGLASADSVGGCYVAFSLWYPTDGFYLMRMNSECERMWPAPVQLDTITFYQMNESKVVTATDGSCLVAWEGAGPQYRLARITADGNILWTVILSDSADSWRAIQPKLASDGQGGAYCTWLKTVGAPYYRKVYAQHVSADGTELWQHRGIPVSLRASEQRQSRPLLDNAGNLIVVWKDGVTNDPSLTNIYSQRISPEGIRLWSDSGQVVCNLPGHQLNPAVVSDYNGGVYVAWEDVGDGLGKSHISATHLNGDGLAGPDPYWIPEIGGLISDTAANADVSPVLVPGLDGSAVVFWSQDLQQSASAQYDFYGQRIVALGLANDDSPPPMPLRHVLYQNYPNPFNPNTEIRFDLFAAVRVELRVFNLLGQEVIKLMDEVRPAGEHRIIWNGKNTSGYSMASGVYICQLRAGEFFAAKKMVLIR
ncbi:T9SS type A sorting domain-containing protein, partial [bacterium]|nr:T9SS type A sorting domain-containing protein [bacterium]